MRCSLPRFFLRSIFVHGLGTAFITAFIVAWSTSTPALAATVSGTITNSANATALSGAEIMFVADGDTSRTFSAADGSYAIELDISPLDVAETPRPQEFVLHQNFPNPFNPSTMIEFELLEPDTVALTVYNVMGQTVRKLVSGQVAAGVHTVAWDGRDDSGMSVSAGVYLYRLSTGGQSVTKKMLLLDGGMHSSSGVSVAASPVYVAPVAEKRSVTPRDFVMAVKLDGYLLYEDYHFSVAADKAVDVAMEEKSGATVSGSVEYSMQYNDGIIFNNDNWDGVVAPITITVYNAVDYSDTLAVKTLIYPDNTYEITGLPEGVVDVVWHGDNVLPCKQIDLSILAGENRLASENIYIMIQTESLSWDARFVVRMKPSYEKSATVKKILTPLGCELKESLSRYGFVTYYCVLPAASQYSMVFITSELLHDYRVSEVYPEPVIIGYKR